MFLFFQACRNGEVRVGVRVYDFQKLRTRDIST